MAMEEWLVLEEVKTKDFDPIFDGMGAICSLTIHLLTISLLVFMGKRRLKKEF